ncbi:MAG: 4'-phosphopantetheinyl transferase superfamily protein [Candidatus Ozemobacteraceae bacterium]
MLAGLLLRQAIMDTWGAEPLHFDFNFNSCGKPALTGRSDFHFNLSHAGSWVVCAIAEHPVGVDVEKMEAVDFASLAQLVFSVDEHKRLHSKSGPEQMDYFFDVWTMKESYCKAVGQGLSIALEKLIITTDDQGRVLIAPHGKEPWRLQRYNVEDGYKLTVCADHETFPEDVKLINWHDLTGCRVSEEGRM